MNNYILYGIGGLILLALLVGNLPGQTTIAAFDDYSSAADYMTGKYDQNCVIEPVAGRYVVTCNDKSGTTSEEEQSYDTGANVVLQAISDATATIPSFVITDPEVPDYEEVTGTADITITPTGTKKSDTLARNMIYGDTIECILKYPLSILAQRACIFEKNREYQENNLGSVTVNPDFAGQCMDSDGNDRTIKGTTTNDGNTKTDRCVGDYLVEEYVCSADVVISSGILKCAEGSRCEDGRCTAGEKAPTNVCLSVVTEACEYNTKCEEGQYKFDGKNAMEECMTVLASGNLNWFQKLIYKQDEKAETITEGLDYRLDNDGAGSVVGETLTGIFDDIKKFLSGIRSSFTSFAWLWIPILLLLVAIVVLKLFKKL